MIHEIAKKIQTKNVVQGEIGRKNSKFFIITNRSGLAWKKQRIELRKYRKIDHVSCVQQAMTKQTFFFLISQEKHRLNCCAKNA